MSELATAADGKPVYSFDNRFALTALSLVPVLCVPMFALPLGLSWERWDWYGWVSGGVVGGLLLLIRVGLYGRWTLNEAGVRASGLIGRGFASWDRIADVRYSGGPGDPDGNDPPGPKDRIRCFDGAGETLVELPARSGDEAAGTLAVLRARHGAVRPMVPSAGEYPPHRIHFGSGRSAFTFGPDGVTLGGASGPRLVPWAEIGRAGTVVAVHYEHDHDESHAGRTTESRQHQLVGVSGEVLLTFPTFQEEFFQLCRARMVRERGERGGQS